MEEWQRICDRHYRARFWSGTFEARMIDGLWTLWFQENHMRRFIRKPGNFLHLASAKRRAKVFDNDHYLFRT